MSFNPYKILELPKNADQSQIKKAFRKKAKQYHPDLNQSKDAHQKFMNIQKAYDVLLNNSWQPTPSKTTTKTKSAEEKYKNVYSAPTSPEEYKEWVKVARGRGKKYAKQDKERLEREVQLLKKIKKFVLFTSILSSIVCSVLLIDFNLPSIVTQKKIHLNDNDDLVSIKKRFDVPNGIPFRSETTPIIRIRHDIYYFINGAWKPFKNSNDWYVSLQFFNLAVLIACFYSLYKKPKNPIPIFSTFLFFNSALIFVLIGAKIFV